MQKTLITLAAVGLTSGLCAATNNDEGRCCPVPQAKCYQEGCDCYYCVGPDMVNPPVRPKTCDGDFAITIAGVYWNSDQDGMEYAINNHVTNPENNHTTYSGDQGESISTSDIEQLNTLIDATYETPDFKWDFGFKLGLSHSSCHDGWDFGFLWTYYRGKANGHIEAEEEDNQTLIPLWSAFAPAQGSILYATDITHNWKLNLDLIDIQIGREFWTSKYLTLRPHVGVRLAYIKQHLNLQHKGGSWSEEPFNNNMDIHNDFHGVGVIAGLESTWHLGCGWGFYGNLATSIVYGRFSIDHDEWNKEASCSFAKTRFVETEDSFRASRAMLDLALGVQWTTMFCDCCYAFTAQLGWESHLFFHQNQMWRIVRIGDYPDSLPNNTGENVYHQRRGTLETEGWTFTVKFEF
ncbi:MAG: hypothetical protein KR126chlam1_00509 [Chlamydiae bacterium]|nr:hypothetical protein [Chlamydiota bacterium]